MAESDDLIRGGAWATEPLVDPDRRWYWSRRRAGASETWRDPFVFRAAATAGTC